MLSCKRFNLFYIFAMSLSSGIDQDDGRTKWTLSMNNLRSRSLLVQSMSNKIASDHVLCDPSKIIIAVQASMVPRQAGESKHDSGCGEAPPTEKSNTLED